MSVRRGLSIESADSGFAAGSADVRDPRRHLSGSSSRPSRFRQFSRYYLDALAPYAKSLGLSATRASIGGGFGPAP